MASTDKPRLSPGRSNRLGISIIFLVHGLISGLWFSHIPWIQLKLILDNRQLSLALLSGSCGSFPGLLFAGALIRKFGSKRMIALTACCYCLMLPVIFLSQSLLALALFLFVNGLFLGAMDVSMNSRASSTESLYGKSIMSSFHAFWSIAGLVAAGAAKVAFSLSWTTEIFISMAALVFIVFIIVAVRLMTSLPDDGMKSVIRGKKQGLIRLPKGPLIPISLIVLLSFISEGAIYDWGALFLHRIRKLDLGSAALGYGGFTFLMAIGRTFGDSLTRRLGRAKTVSISSFFAAACLAVSVIVPIPALSLGALALTGLGMANIIPILFSAAGKSGVMDPASGIAAVSMIGYFGFMLGPPLMGFVADTYSLKLTMTIILAISLLLSLVSAIFLKTKTEVAAGPGNDKDYI